jgi:hypothetical protein
MGVWMRAMVEYRHSYDNIIVHIMFIQNKTGQYSATDVYNIVRKYGRSKGRKQVPGKDTVQRHLYRLVEAKYLVKHKEAGPFNKTLYSLSPRTIAWLSKREF